MFSPATVRAPAERSRRRAICSDAGLEAPRRNRLRRRARNDPRCGFVDDGLSATGPLAVEKSDDFPTAQPFAHKLHSAPIICIEIILEDTRRVAPSLRRRPRGVLRRGQPAAQRRAARAGGDPHPGPATPRSALHQLTAPRPRPAPAHRRLPPASTHTTTRKTRYARQHKPSCARQAPQGAAQHQRVAHSPQQAHAQGR